MPNLSSNDADQLFAAAVRHHQAGQLPQAEAIYRQILAAAPRHAGALQSLGVLAHQVGRDDVAVELIRQAVALAPGRADFWCNLGEIYRMMGQVDPAIAAHRRAIEIKPDLVDAHFNLGTAFLTAGRAAEAVTSLRTALSLNPNHPQALNNLGNALLATGHLDDAIAAFRAGMKLAPDQPDVYNNLGKALLDKGEAAEAVTLLRQAVRLHPGFSDAFNNLGTALGQLRQMPEAIAAYRQALALNPRCADAHNNLGNILQDLGRYDEAVASLRNALQIKPDAAGTHYNLGNALRAKGRLDEAIASYGEALRLQPGYADALNNRGNAFKDKGMVEEAIAWYRRTLAAKPDAAGEHGNILLTLNYLPDYDPQALFEEHLRWNQAYAQPLAHCIEPHRNDRSPDRILRIGYVSPDFYSHSVAYFMEGVLASHDRGAVEVFCYPDVARPDQVTTRLQSLVPHWHSIHKVPDGDAAALIRGHHIDILVDLAGHTAHNRLLLFARKPAPVQMTYLGYSNTTGMTAIDYRLTDAYADPPGTGDGLHMETLLRLPEIFACYRPPDQAPPVGPPPALAAGHVTFGSFHTLAKLNDPVFDLWARVLAQAPNSRLLMVAAGLNQPSCRARLSAFFASRGIAASRLVFRGSQPLADYLSLHNQVDVALDSHPFSGHTIACHALWMGVPVVTHAGGAHRSRMVASGLNAIGLPELIAQTEDDFVRIATTLAADLNRVQTLRATMRQRMQASCLMDARRFTAHLESAYRAAWRRWCDTPT